MHVRVCNWVFNLSFFSCAFCGVSWRYYLRSEVDFQLQTTPRAPHGSPSSRIYRRSLFIETFKRCLGGIPIPRRSLGGREPAPTKLWVTTKPAEAAEPSDALSRRPPVPKSLCPIYSGKQRIFISTSEGNVRLCNPGDEENEAFFPGEKCCEIVQTAFGFHGHSPKLLYHKINSQSAGLWG